jgi:RNA polymerase sigma-70 factor, ECF subfamily
VTVAVAPEARSAVRRDPDAGDQAARLYRRHSGWIYGYCLRRLRSPEEAEDALQTTYLHACRSLEQGFEPRADSAWLFRLAENVCVSRLRSSGRRARLERVQDVALLEGAVAAPHRPADELIGLSEALASLTAKQRRAILLREWQGLSYREVAAELGLTQAAVEALIFRARRSLAAALENPERRRPGLLHGLGIPGLLASAKSFFVGGGTAVGVKVAAGVAVVASATVIAADPVGWHVKPADDAPRAAASPRAVHAKPAAVPAAAESDPVSSRSRLERSGHLLQPAEPPARSAPGSRLQRGPELGQATASEARSSASGGEVRSATGSGRSAGQERAVRGQAEPPEGKAQAPGQATRVEVAPSPPQAGSPGSKQPDSAVSGDSASQAESPGTKQPDWAASGDSPPQSASGEAETEG